MAGLSGQEIVKCCRLCGASHRIAAREYNRGDVIEYEDRSVWSEAAGSTAESYTDGDCPGWDDVVAAARKRADRWRIFRKGFYPEGHLMLKPCMDMMIGDAIGNALLNLEA